jgi:hypothetical protein
MARESQSILAPVVIAAMGLVPLGLMAGGTTAHPEPVVVQEPAVVNAVTETTIATPTEVVITTPAPTLTGVSDEIARVLAAEGFAAEETVVGLPDSVVDLLNESGVVLTIAVEGGE